MRRYSRALRSQLPHVFTWYVPFVLFLAMHYYFYVRLVRDVMLPDAWRPAVALMLAAAALSIPAAMIANPVRRSRPFVWLAFSWMGCTSILLVLLLFGDAGRTLIGLAAPLATGREQVVASPVFVSRAVGITAAVGTCLLSAVAIVLAARPRVEHVRVALKRLPRALDGFVIAQISDLHIAPGVRDGFVEDIVRQTNALQPDLIAITGDLADGPLADLKDHVAPLAQLSARHGVFFVAGNHDHSSGLDEWVTHLTGMGVRVLRNERVTVGHGEAVMDVVGLDDTAVAAHDATAAGSPFEGADPNRELLLLAHQPKAIAQAVFHGVGLMLAGHTHGGQLWPWGLVVRLVQPYVAGLHLHEGKTWIYVSRGTGYWGPPMRLGAAAEITRIELSCGAACD